jgi:hypothetical protein
MRASVLFAILGILLLLLGAVMYRAPLRHPSFRSADERSVGGGGLTAFVRGSGLGAMLAGGVLLVVALAVRVLG